MSGLTEAKYLASLGPAGLTIWASCPDLWAAGRNVIVSMQVNMKRNTDVVIPEWDELTVKQQVSFCESLKANQIPVMLGACVSGVTLLVDG